MKPRRELHFRHSVWRKRKFVSLCSERIGLFGGLGKVNNCFTQNRGIDFDTFDLRGIISIVSQVTWLGTRHSHHSLAIAIDELINFIGVKFGKCSCALGEKTITISPSLSRRSSHNRSRMFGLKVHSIANRHNGMLFPQDFHRNFQFAFRQIRSAMGFLGRIIQRSLELCKQFIGGCDCVGIMDSRRLLDVFTRTTKCCGQATNDQHCQTESAFAYFHHIPRSQNVPSESSPVSVLESTSNRIENRHLIDFSWRIRPAQRRP